jgi:hypothetical protein
MKALTFYVKRGDTGRPLEAALETNDGTPQPIPAGASVRFRMVRAGAVSSTPPTVDGVCEIVDAELGRVRYRWAPEDVATLGIYRGEIVLVFDDESEVTFPSGGPPLDFIHVHVQRDVVVP